MFNKNGANEIMAECIELGEKKNNDYSGKLDSISMAGLPGINVRLLDKVCRTTSLATSGVIQQVVDEKLEDTYKDIINYATYAIMLIRGTWGKES